jgi:hypothetical protein
MRPSAAARVRRELAAKNLLESVCRSDLLADHEGGLERWLEVGEQA